MQNKVLLITFIVSLGLIAFLITKLNSSQILSTQNPCTPTFVDGGGPNYKNDSPERKNISPENSNGTPLAIEGKIYHSDCKTPVKNAILDIWQANETGNYEDEWYRGKVITNNKGEYSFSTVVPKGYGEGTAFRPPHIHFKVWVDGKEIITSQMFFPESKGKAGFDDAYIMNISESTFFGNKKLKGQHDIILPI